MFKQSKEYVQTVGNMKSKTQQSSSNARTIELMVKVSVCAMLKIQILTF